MSFGSLVFTPLVKKLQERYGSRRQYERMENSGATQDRLTEFETEFLAQRDSFYMATTGATGWPYVQHRGGPKGFLKVIDDRTLAFGDLRGNKQYISLGNFQHDDRVALFFMDYPNQTRLKILGRVEVHENDAQSPALLQSLRTDEPNAVVERAILIHVEGFDWNCPQHITPRHTIEELQDVLAPLRQKLEKLDTENAALRARLRTLEKPGD